MKIGYFFPGRGGAVTKSAIFMLLKRHLEVEPSLGHLKILENWHGGKGELRRRIFNAIYL